jgi:hypothetical protein
MVDTVAVYIKMKPINNVHIQTALTLFILIYFSLLLFQGFNLHDGLKKKKKKKNSYSSIQKRLLHELLHFQRPFPAHSFVPQSPVKGNGKSIILKVMFD